MSLASLFVTTTYGTTQQQSLTILGEGLRRSAQHHGSALDERKSLAASRLDTRPQILSAMRHANRL